MKQKKVQINKKANDTRQNIQNLIKQALYLHRLSKFDEAKILYEKILRLEPNHSDTLQLLGMLYNALNRKDEAIKLIKQAITIHAHYIYYNNLGSILQKQGKLDEAIEAFKNALSLNPTYVEAYVNLGNTLHLQGKSTEAIEAFKKILSLNPNLADVYFKIGFILQTQNKHNEAIEPFIKAISLNPKYTKAYYNLGVALQNEGKINQAIEAYTKALSLNPHYVDAYNDLGNALQVQEKCDEAIMAYKKALSLNPNFANAYNNLGNIFQAKGRTEEAIEVYKKALSLNPNFAETYNNFGNVLQTQGKIEQAMEVYKKALSLNPNYASAYNNLGNILQVQGKIERAIEAYKKALSLNPKDVNVYLHLSLAYLLSGNLMKGFQLYEFRWQSFLKKSKRNFVQPLWLGKEDINARTILVYTEQGLGDTLQFCRYIEMLAKQGANVIFEVDKPLIRLLQSLQGVATLIEKGSPLPECDYHCPLLSLPYIFHTSLTSIPTQNPYIHVDQALLNHWENTLGEKRALRVGLVWSGGFRANQPELWHVNNRRNIPLSLIVKLNRPDVDFYSLQKGDPAESEFKECAHELWKGHNLFNYMDNVTDFADTAGLISHLDLVISVDTSTAHLAAAMGKPVWLLNRFDSCWRWMLHREDSPWYPTLILFRQPFFGDWEGVIQNVRNRLDALVIYHSEG